jgi:CHASE3 domain sensor protein
VNGSYAGDDAIGKLMQDFKCKKPDEFHYTPIAESVRFFKETEEGRSRMCEKVERYAEQCVQESTEQHVRALMENMNLSFDEAVEVLKVDKKQIRALREMMSVDN